MITRPLAARLLPTTLTVVAAAAGLAGCHAPGQEGVDVNFTVVNQTKETLQIVGHTAGLPSSTDITFHVAPGASGGAHAGSLARGTCVDIEFKAYDTAGTLVATDSAPICEDKDGQGGTWTIPATAPNEGPSPVPT